MLWALHEELGYGPVRLRRIWEKVIRTRAEFRCFFRDGKDIYQEQETGQNIEDFALARYLADIGVDVKAWEAEEVDIDEQSGEVTFHRKDKDHV